MRPKIILVIAVIFGIATTLLLINFLEKIENEKKVVGDTISVVVAERAIDANQIIRAEMLTFTEIPKDYINCDYVTKKEDLVNKLSLAYIAKSEVISPKRILGTDEQIEYLSQKIASNHKAITIDVSNENSVGQLIVPNDKVDIMYSEITSVDSVNNVFYDTVIIFEKIKVLAIDRTLYLDSLTNEYRPYESVTLEMTKDESKKLVKYRLQGEIDVVLNSRIIEE